MWGMSYNFRTVVGDQSQTGVRQRLDKGWTEVGQGLDRGWTGVGQKSEGSLSREVFDSQMNRRMQ